MGKFKRKFRKLLGLKKKDGLNTCVYGESFHCPQKTQHPIVKILEALATWFIVGIILELVWTILKSGVGGTQ